MFVLGLLAAALFGQAIASLEFGQFVFVFHGAAIIAVGMRVRISGSNLARAENWVLRRMKLASYGKSCPDAGKAKSRKPCLLQNRSLLPKVEAIFRDQRDHFPVRQSHTGLPLSSRNWRVSVPFTNCRARITSKASILTFEPVTAISSPLAKLMPISS